MKLLCPLEVVEIANEYMAIPIGEGVSVFNGVIALNEATAFLLKQMKTSKTKDELVGLLSSEYEVDRETAEHDIDSLINKLLQAGMIEE